MEGYINNCQCLECVTWPMSLCPLLHIYPFHSMGSKAKDYSRPHVGFEHFHSLQGNIEHSLSLLGPTVSSPSHVLVFHATPRDSSILPCACLAFVHPKTPLTLSYLKPTVSTCSPHFNRRHPKILSSSRDFLSNSRLSKGRNSARKLPNNIKNHREAKVLT